jgi:hypothetical protein
MKLNEIKRLLSKKKKATSWKNSFYFIEMF